MARLLIVDDDRTLVSLLSQMVGFSGHTSIGAYGGQQALDLVASQPIDLMLLDLKMPWMDGFDVLKWLRAHPEFDTLPVVVLTSSKLQNDVDQSRQLGVYDYRVKPHGFDDLVRLLDDVRKCWLDERFNRYCVAHAETGEARPGE